MHFLYRYFRQRWLWVVLFLLICTVFFTTFALYHLPLRAVLYPVLLSACLGAVFVFLDFRQARRKHQTLQVLQQSAGVLLSALPPAVTGEDADYQKIIHALCEEQKRLETTMALQYADMVEYYTIWAHQIKTPIAAMRLHLQNEDSALSRILAADLLRIEQYVDMVLMFLRLDSDATDYVIRSCDLDAIVRQAVKKFAGEFIGRKLQLAYKPLEIQVLTDEKWLSFVIEQVLSNALKYTPAGTITIDLERPATLCIRDTGIGIAPEDLPRIFERGYTGYNGRSDKKASGIGLYLCRRVCTNLGHKITASASPGSGTAIRIDLSHRKLEIE